MNTLNFQYSHEEWPMFLLTHRIGTFIEEFNPRRTVRIELAPLVMENLYDIRFLYFSQYEKDGMLDDAATREWINRRVFPKNRINKEKLLEDMGLSDYDQIAILKHNMGTCCKDYIWIKFRDVPLERMYINLDKIMSDPFWRYNEGFVPKTLQEIGINVKAAFCNRDDR